MDDFLIDSSALWRMLRSDDLADAWQAHVAEGAIQSCEPQRAEFRRSARSRRELTEFNDMFSDSFPDAALPKSAWRWVEAAQFALADAGAHRGLSVVDLLICAAAAHNGLVVLHDDADFETVARFVDGVRVERVDALLAQGHDGPTA